MTEKSANSQIIVSLINHKPSSRIMSQNATASWSGYSHQGKIGIIIALRKIHQLDRVGLENYYIEYETQEDVKLVQGGNVIEVHQVKAKLDTPYIGSYTAALISFKACAGQNCLHTIAEITNWDTLTPVQNPRNVQRYPYSPALNYCRLQDIEAYILSEIHTILQQAGHPQAQNEAWQKHAYLECMGILDDRIRFEHATKDQAHYEVKLQLTEILNCLLVAPNHKRMITCAIREKIFQQYIDFVKRLNNGAIVLSNDHETVVKGIIERISLLDDDALETFLNQIFPYSTIGKTLGSIVLTDDFFKSDAFVSPFLRTLIAVQATPLTLEGNTYPHYRAASNYLLTGLQTSDTLVEDVAMNILIHDKLNVARYEAHYVITEHYTGCLMDFAYKLLDKRTSILAPNNLAFVTAQNAIQTLN